MRLKDLKDAPAKGGGSIRNWRRSSFVLLRLFLGVIFVYASFDKIFRPAAFAEIIYNYQILPEPLINLASIFLPWLELLLGLLLILGFWLPGAVLVCNSLFLVFFATLVFNSARGLDIDCGCFSVSTEASSGGHMLWYVLRDGFFMLAGLYLFYLAFLSKPSQTSRVALRETFGIMLIAITLGLVVNQLRSDRLPLIANWSPETRLTLKLGEKILIPFNEARDKFFSGAAVFIDARPVEEYRKGHIQGARNLHIGAFDEKAGEVLIDLPEDTLIITYCDGEKCTLSAELALKLRELGYENVRVLFNGWIVWKNLHLPTQAEEAQAR
jgi:rhodanese-related sulfurtransferase/uncharacterized membrane protein YphA (DoxX/SURF4 family)